MSDFSISAEPRTVLGNHVKTLRRQDIVPGVIYGKGVEPQHVQFDGPTLRTLFRRGGKTEEISVTVGGATHKVIVQELQRHITRGDLMHLDLMVVA